MMAGAGCMETPLHACWCVLDAERAFTMCQHNCVNLLGVIPAHSYTVQL